MRKSVHTVILTCLLKLLITASAGEQQIETMPKPEEFAILPWGWTPGDLKSIKDIRDCGFNLAGFVAPEHLDLVSQAGLKCIVSAPTSHISDTDAAMGEKEIDERVQALIQRVAGHKAVFGYYLRDEPGASAYPGLARWSAAYRKAAPHALPYINLFPNYASSSQLGVPTYNEYLEKFVQTVKPSYISYDHYALMEDGSVRQGYFSNLESVRSVALRHNLPFWNIVLANAHFNYAEPTEAGLRFQLYTTLAYGGRGISYFTYFTPSVGNYRMAPIDQFGNKTLTWEMLRRVNLQIHKLMPIYLKMKSVNVFHHPDVPSGCNGIQSSKYFSEVSGGSLLVGEFEGPDGRPHMILVNKDLNRSITFGMKPKSNGKFRMVNAYTGSVEPWVGENNWLAAGQGMLLILDR